MKSVQNHVQEITGLVQEGQFNDDTQDFLYDLLDDWMLADQFGYVNDFLLMVINNHPDTLEDLYFGVSLLSLTHVAMEKLGAYAQLYQIVSRNAIQQKGPQKGRETVKGFSPLLDRKGMKLSLIVAMDRNRVIGKNGEIPWRIPEDFQHFRRETYGHVVIMGSRTFDSLPGRLKNRVEVVLSRSRKQKEMPEGVHVFSNMEEALEFAYTRDSCPFVIGGASLFLEVESRLTDLFITEVEMEIEGGDTFFPEFGEGFWSSFEEVYQEKITEGATVRWWSRSLP